MGLKLVAAQPKLPIEENGAMAKFLKGNYQLPDETKMESKKESATGNSGKSLTERFEDSVLAKLGGSICFVTKGKTLLWRGDDSEAPSQ